MLKVFPAVALLMLSAITSLTAYAGQYGAGGAPGVSHGATGGIGHIAGSNPSFGYRGNGSSLRQYPRPPFGPSSNGPGFTPALGGFYGINSGAYRSTGGGGHNRGSHYLPYPLWYTPYFFPDAEYSQGPYVNPANDAPAPEAQAYQDLAAGQNDISEQVRRLSDEMERMRSEQRNSVTEYVDAQPATTPQTPITLVLRDGRQLEVQNYAIMNQTFWDFTAQPVRKIPIGNIDVTESTRRTEAKGAEFPRLTNP